MKNPLYEISNAGIRSCLTLDPKDLTSILPPLVEPKAVNSSNRMSKRSTVNNVSEGKLRRELKRQTEPNVHIFQSPTEQSVDKLIKLILQKGKRTNEYLNLHQINSTEFIEQHLKVSPTIRVQLKGILQKLLSRGQTNLDLKGINRQIIEKIETLLSNTLQNERNLYLVRQDFTKKSSNIAKELQDYRESLRQSISQL